MSKKTVSIEWLKEKANKFLADSEDDMELQRGGISALLEAALFETDNYKGFQYLTSEYLPTEEQTEGNVLRPGYDESRRRYF